MFELPESEPDSKDGTLPLANPLLAEWQGPAGGVPPFDRIRVEHFVPALDVAIAAALREVGAIAANTAPPTFANTIEALERSGSLVERVRTIANVWRTASSTPEFQAVESDLMTKLAGLTDRIVQNSDLFDRIEAIYRGPEMETLSEEQGRLVWFYYTDFVRAGAALDSTAKRRLTEINRNLAELSTRFDQNVLADERSGFVLLESADDLSGLPEPEREAAASAALARGFEGKWLIANTRSAVEPFLTHSDRRDLRERVYRMFVGRGDSPGEGDNKPIISEILALRAERARLLGYETHAHWAAERQMASSPEKALELMFQVWPAAVERLQEEVAAMRPALDPAGDPSVQPWDYRYFADGVRRLRANLDWDQVRPYLQLESLREGMFWVAGELFDLDFAPVDVPVYHPDVRVWSVTDRSTTRHVGLFYFDPFARPGKKSGAWMNHYRRQRRLDDEVTPIVSNNSNFLPGGGTGDPVLISWTDAKTLFHEFGHALHGLLSNVKYPAFAGTAVATDYVEFPSQMLEHWLPTTEFLDRFAIHFRTGEPIPAELVLRIEDAARLSRAFGTVEEMASGFLDMYIHLETREPIDPEVFEREVSEKIGLPHEIAMRHRPPHFGHIFSGDHYAAKYYSYLWADVLTADAAEAFREAGGFYDKPTAERLRDNVLSAGNSVDPESGYVAFRGRPPRVDSLMRKRGLID